MTRPSLTDRERQTFALIRTELVASRRSPSFEELKDRLGFRSKSCVSRLVGQLKKKGYIVKGDGWCRSIALAPGADAYTIHPEPALERRLIQQAALRNLAPESVILAALSDYLGGST